MSSVAILGDVHLGRGDATTGYGGSEAELVAWLKHLASQAELVVVNGDLLDLDRGVFPLAFRRELALVEARWPEVFSTLEAIGALLLTGNHDEELHRQGRANRVLELDVGGARVHIEHGHRLDGWMKRQRRFTQLVTWASGRASAWGAAPFYRLLRLGERLVSGGAGTGPRRLHERALSWLEGRPEIELMVIGHTHTQTHLMTTRGQLLLNAGEAMRAPFESLHLDGAQRRWRLERWSPDSGAIVQEEGAWTESPTSP